MQVEHRPAGPGELTRPSGAPDHDEAPARGGHHVPAERYRRGELTGEAPALHHRPADGIHPQHLAALLVDPQMPEEDDVVP